MSFSTVQCCHERISDRCRYLCGHSDALVADGLHTFLDLLMDGVTYAACKLANRPADQSHPYGYKRVETLACLILSFLLCVIGVGIVYESIFYP